MSRKDTILIGVLVNIGVLIVLFLSSIRHEPIIVTQSGIPDPVKVDEKETKAIDPIDLVLSQYEQQQKKQNEERVEQAPVQPQAVIAQTTEYQEKEKAVIPLVKANSGFSHDIQEIVVKNGDFLEKIAKEHKTTVNELKKINQLTSSSLQVGQVLFVPKSAPKLQKREELTPVAEYYVVKNGDSPWTIAKKNHIKVEELLQLNHLDEAKAKKLKPGDKLRIR